MDYSTKDVISVGLIGGFIGAFLAAVLMFAFGIIFNVMPIIFLLLIPYFITSRINDLRMGYEPKHSIYSLVIFIFYFYLAIFIFYILIVYNDFRYINGDILFYHLKNTIKFVNPANITTNFVDTIYKIIILAGGCYISYEYVK